MNQSQWKKGRALSFAVAACALSWTVGTDAQTYPVRPIRMIAPYPTGGGIDTVARALSEKLAAALGQPVVVDNRPGAGATIGAELLAKSAPDGYTLMLGSLLDYAIAPHFHRNLSFDMRRDFVAISELGYGTIGLVVTPSLAAKSVKELVALAKAKPGQLIYVSSGHGGLVHLNGEMFKQATGVEFVHVPYKGTTQMLPDLLSARVHFSLDNVLAYLPHIKAGRIRVLAVASRNRSPLLPDTPTMTEAGVVGYESATNYTLFAPTGIRKEQVALLNKEASAAMKQPEVRDKLLNLGVVVIGSTHAAAQARIPEEMERWARVIKTGNIQPL